MMISDEVISPASIGSRYRPASLTLTFTRHQEHICALVIRRQAAQTQDRVGDCHRNFHLAIQRGGNMRQLAALPSLGGGRSGKIAAGAAICAGAAIFLIVVAAALRSSPLAGPLSVRRHQGIHAHWWARCPTAARTEVPPSSAHTGPQCAHCQWAAAAGDYSAVSGRHKGTIILFASQVLLLVRLVAMHAAMSHSMSAGCRHIVA